MIVKVTNFDENAEMPYIDYEVSGLLQNQMDFLNENLEEETSISNGKHLDKHERLFSP